MMYDFAKNSLVTEQKKTGNLGCFTCPLPD